MTTTYYTEEHEWLAVDGTLATVGITPHAVEQLGDLVFVELPEVDADLTKGGEAAVVESVKAASDVYAPLAGKVVEVNAALSDDPELVNRDPMGEGWIYKMELADTGALDALMDEAAYKALVG